MDIIARRHGASSYVESFPLGGWPRPRGRLTGSRVATGRDSASLGSTNTASVGRRPLLEVRKRGTGDALPHRVLRQLGSQKRAEFEGNAKSLEDEAKKVAALSRAKDQAGTQAAVTGLGRTTCGACHDAFRGPEIKS
jgi:Cytochrome C'